MFNTAFILLALIFQLLVSTSNGYSLPSMKKSAFSKHQSEIAASRFQHTMISTPMFSQSLLRSTSEDLAEADTVADIPTYLPSGMGVDYIPLATFLATGDFLAADQFTRDVLIKLCGAEANNRNFVYWTEVNKIPSIDLATIERLWLTYSNGNFGYSIQKRVWEVENGNFDNFIRRIGWTKIDGGIERKLRWFGSNEFIYDPKKAPKAHLPLTSALRGTQLLKALLSHPVWNQYDWKNYESIKWEK